MTAANGAHTAPKNPGRVLGIVGLVLVFVVSAVGLILSIVALVRSRRAGYRNAPAVWGIVLGAVFLVAGVVVLVLYFTLVGASCEGLDAGTYPLDNGGQLSCS